MRKPLAAPALCMAGGIVVSRMAPFSTAEGVVYVVAFASSAAACYWFGRRRLAVICVWLACGALGLLNAVSRPDRAKPEQSRLVTGGESQRLAGCVVEPSVVRGDRMQFTLEVAEGERARVSIGAKKDGWLPAPLAYGQRVALEARVREVRGFRNPGAFDLEQYLARRGIYWNAMAARGQAPEELGGSCGPGWRRVLEGWRAGALRRIDALYPGDGYHAAMMRGLLLGDKSGIKRVWVEDFRRTGTYHALVISGSHVTLVCGLFLLWRRWSGIGARTVLILSGVTAWAYALMAGGDPPVLRAAAGFALFVVAALFYRRASVLNLLAAVAIAFLAVDPGQLFDASFQLSFLAVAALGAFTPEPWRGRIPDRRAESKRLERRLLAETVHYVTRVPLQAARGGVEAAARVLGGAWALFVMSAAVQAGLALPMALFFHRVSITGLTANVVVAPVVSQAIPFGFLAVFTGWQWPARAAAWLMDISQTVAAWHARYEPEWRIPDPPLWLAVAIPCAFVACAMARGGKWRLGWAAVCAGLLVLLVAHPFAPRTVAGELELSALDVGQGESLVVGLPNGELAAVDGGGLPQFGRRGGELFDIGEEVVSPYLWARGVKRLAAVAVTHLHDDHAGGIVALMENFRPREVWTAFTPENEAWLRIAEKARQRGIAVRVLHQGERFEFGGARWEVLAPVGGQNWKGKPRNNDSLVLRVRHGRHAFLLTGDIERGVEARLLEEGELEPVQVLKVAHHGSRLSTLPVLLDTLRPAVALISAGAGNMYGLPHPSVVEELRRRGMFVMRTDKDGLVTVRSDGRYLGVEPSRLARAQWSAWDLF